MAEPTTTLYRVRDDRLETGEFTRVERDYPMRCFFTRPGAERGDPAERVYVEGGKLDHGWCLTREKAVERAIETANNRVEVCEERLRMAVNRLAKVQLLK